MTPDFWHTMIYAFGATLLGAPMLITVTAAAAFGPLSLLSALVGVAAASLPWYLLGSAIRQLGVRLPRKLEVLAQNVHSPAIAAAATPSYALYWLVTALADMPFKAAAMGSLAVSLPMALIFGATTITGHRIGLPTPIVAAATLAVFIGVRYVIPKRRATQEPA